MWRAGSRPRHDHGGIVACNNQVVLEMFTDQAREAVARAEQEAREMGHAAIHVEHLLLGLLCDDESAVGRVLADFAVTVEPVRFLVRERLGLNTSLPSQRQLPFSPDAKGVLRSAHRIGMGEPRPEHLLLAILVRGQAGACGILRDLGADPNRIRFETKKRTSPLSATSSDTKPGARVRSAIVKALGELDLG